jgi:hypothetical protein
MSSVDCHCSLISAIKPSISALKAARWMQLACRGQAWQAAAERRNRRVARSTFTLALRAWSAIRTKGQRGFIFVPIL